MKRSIRSIRIDLNYNQEEMAKLLNISQASYQKKENGTSPLLARELEMISNIANIPMGDITIPL